MLAIEGAIVTIDAMGCQRDIARKLRDKKADYVLALKGNQTSLSEDVDVFVTEQKAKGFVDTTISKETTIDGDHGRIETRTTTVIHDVEWLRQRHDWPGLKAVVMVESTRETSGKLERETRLYITSLVLLAGVVQNLPFPGYTGVQKAPACEGRIATGRVSCAGGCAPPRGQACWG
jgi:predicted transposase YbfD/YdcC